jgi:hypothetical protein
MAWEKGKLTDVTLHSKLGKPGNFRYGDNVVDLILAANISQRLDNDLKP